MPFLNQSMSAANTMVNFEGEVRRIDLYLRSLYVDIDTIIYRISEFDYQIFSEHYPGDFQAFQDKFHNEIRFMGTPVKLTNTPVIIFEKQIPPISDTDIPKNFEGVPMNLMGLYNLLLIKFPDINIYKISGAQPLFVHVYAYDEITVMGKTSHFINKEQRGRLLSFLNNMGMATSYEIVEDQVVSPPNLDMTLAENPVQYLNSNKLWNRNIGEFSERDEALWSDNLEGIYEGKFKKEDLYFYEADDYACYIDYTGGKHIDIRNFLLLYKTIYLTPPYEKDTKKWLAEQRITEQEFLELAVKGRIKIVLAQPEFRYHMGLFNEIYQVAPHSVITRRAIAALQQIDLIEMSDNFLLKDPALLRETKKFCELAAPVIGYDSQIYYEMLSWPIKARRNSFETLHRKGSFGTANYGVNNFVSKIVEQRLGKSYDFEFTISAANIHFAHALNATYYPYQSEHQFSDAYFAHLMGIYLNMFKLSTPENIGLLSRDDSAPITPIQLNPIDIIEIDNYVPLTEFESILEESRSYPGGRKLMETLAPLCPEQRQAKIARYNSLVKQAVQKKKGKAFKIDLFTNGILDGVGAITNFMGLGIFYSLFREGGKKLVKNVPEFKQISNQLEDSIYHDPDQANIHFLTKINRVAGLKKF